MLAALALALGCSIAADDVVTEPMLRVTATAGAEPPTLAPTRAPVATQVVQPTATPVVQPTFAPSPTPVPTLTPTPVPAIARTGVQVLVDDDFAPLHGMRVGLITGRVIAPDEGELVDLLSERSDLELVKAFAPEHGIRGALDAGEAVDGSVDPRTGIPIVSLYGATRAPSLQDLAGIDVLVYDLQDVGTRFYTYISTMGLAMHAAADAGVAFVVLDRPNPQGGGASSGFVTESGFESFISQYPIPASYGLTAGELASMIKGEGWMGDLSGLDLRIVEMDGWARSGAATSDTPWAPPSPGLPTAHSARVYPGTVLFEATALSVGRGTDETFARIGAPWIDGARLAGTLNARLLPGVRFESVEWTPEPTDVGEPRWLGASISGVRIEITDSATYEPVADGVHLLTAVRDHAAQQGAGPIIERPDHLDLLAGTDRLRVLLSEGASAETIIDAWAQEAAAFDSLRASYERY